MDKWLRCEIFPGQFTSEFAVRGKLFDSSGFSMFAEKEDVHFEEHPTPDHPVRGHIRIKALQQQDDLVLIALPQSTLESGSTITVKADTLVDGVK